MSKIKSVGKKEKGKMRESCMDFDKSNEKITFGLDVDYFMYIADEYLYSEIADEVNIEDFKRKYLDEMIDIEHRGLTESAQYLVAILAKGVKSPKEIERKLNVLEGNMEDLLFGLSISNMLTDVYELIDSINQNKS